ncbi:MAG: hypothetical protein MI757_22115, partial [Pirellulales bacterium]|nr:hypothetical protein [Pirellulales bacterium]
NAEAGPVPGKQVGAGKAKGKAPNKRKPSRSVGPAVSGPGWVVKLNGYHLYNSIDQEGKDIFVKKNLMNAISTKKIEVFDQNGQRKNITLRDLGLKNPVFTRIDDELYRTIVYNPNDMNNPAADRRDDNPLRFEFSLEMVYQPKPLEQRRTTPIAPKPLTTKRDDADTTKAKG